MQDQEVDLLDAELGGTLLEAVQGLVVPVVADPDLRLEKDLGPVDVRVSQTFADLLLIAVGSGGVDVAVSGGQCRLHCSARLVGRGLEHAESECGQVDAVVQGEVLAGHEFLFAGG